MLLVGVVVRCEAGSQAGLQERGREREEVGVVWGIAVGVGQSVVFIGNCRQAAALAEAVVH